MGEWLKRAALAALALIAGFLLVKYHRPLLAFFGDQEQVRAWLAGLGPWGPLGLIGLNAAQVVVAPIPGYVMQIASGYLFGWLDGAIYGTIGMALGGILAMGLARLFGRPLVSRLVGEERLDRWERVTHLDALPIWFILMLGPFGDIPYFIAGLTSLAIWKVIAIALFVRTPSVIVAAAVGAGVVSWRSPWVIGGAILFMSLAVVAIRNQQRIEQWVDETLLKRVLRSTADGKRSEEQRNVDDSGGKAEVDATAN
jgi:uncharacterized membrane protein YdjX (TVP38/TMEM64 family)